MPLKNRNVLIVAVAVIAIVIGLSITARFQASSTTDPLGSFESIFSNIKMDLEKAKGHFGSSYFLADYEVDYDVKTTNSLVAPYVAEIRYEITFRNESDNYVAREKDKGIARFEFKDREWELQKEGASLRFLSICLDAMSRPRK